MYWGGVDGVLFFPIRRTQAGVTANAELSRSEISVTRSARKL